MNNPQEKAHELIVYLSKRKDSKLITKEMLADAYELIFHHEWGIALEIVMEILYEGDFSWDEKGLRIAQDAWQAAGLDWSIWKSLLKTGS